MSRGPAFKGGAYGAFAGQTEVRYLMTSYDRILSVRDEVPRADSGVNECNPDRDDDYHGNEIFEQCRSLLVDHRSSLCPG